jgi:4-hydroxybenzoate polyprenyltransferase
MLSNLSKSFTVFSKDIKIWHSVFALPFVLGSMILNSPLDISLYKFIWIILSMICARSFAMGANRYLDRHLDKKNPRTNKRALPAGEISPLASLGWSLFCGVAFVFSATQISFICGLCSLGVLLILFLYPLIKKISYYCHFYLGFCLALSPIGAEIASSAQVSLHTIVLSIAIMLWTAGFDIIYATQDVSVDRNQGLFSIPAQLGGTKALYISRILFVLVCLLLCLVGYLCAQNIYYYLGVCLVAFLLFYEHYLVKDISEDKSSKNIDKAFFNVNALVSVIYCLFTTVAWITKT